MTRTNIGYGRAQGNWQPQYEDYYLDWACDTLPCETLLDARTAWEKYLGSQRYVASAEEAARQIGRKYDLGVASVTDYNASVTASVKARSQLLQAKYEYLFKNLILKYYNN